MILLLAFKRGFIQFALVTKQTVNCILINSLHVVQVENQMFGF